MQTKVKIKICGITNVDNMCKLLFLEPDYMGFIFYQQSKRCVLGKMEPESLNIIPSRVKRVGVFVDATENDIRMQAAAYGLTTIQLHGKESPELCSTLQSAGFEVIKAFSIADNHDFENIGLYTDCVDEFLFDTKVTTYGGSGHEFDWQLILRQPLRKPWFLAGGISPDNILAASETGAAALDLNSCFETSPGIKDYDLLKTAIDRVRNR